MANLFQSSLNWMAKSFAKDTSKMFIITGVAGWTLSSLAQIMTVAVNPKIKDEQKMFLIPQEFSDAVVNIGSFFLISQLTKKTVAKLFSTGKFTTKKVRTFLNEHKDIYGDKVGKIDFDLDSALKYESEALRKSHANIKNLGTTIATVSAGILASNIITPILRNKMASTVQKSYLNESKEEHSPKKLATVQNVKVSPVSNSGQMRI